MIEVEDFVLELEDDEEKRNFKLGKVVELFDNDTAKIQFDGEETPSEKQYAYLSSYVPTKNDRVLLAVTGGTYIILGKVNFNIAPDSGEEEIDRYLFDLKKVTILKGLEVSGALTANNGASIIGNVGVNGNVMATGAITGASANINGTLQAGATTLAGLTVNGNIDAGDINGSTIDGSSLDINGTSYFRGTFRHTGSYLGFFSGSATSKKLVSRYVWSSNGPTIGGVADKLNDLIDALHYYNLV